MAKTKKFYVAALFLALAASIAAVCYVAMPGKRADFANLRLVKTEERNFSYGSASYRILQQNDLFDPTDTDTIFMGTYTRSENYTYAYYDDEYEKNFDEYFTFYYFTVNKVYYGDKTLLGKEIPLVVWNIRDRDITTKYEIIPKADSDYLLFSYKYTPSQVFQVSIVPPNMGNAQNVGKTVIGPIGGGRIINV